MLAFECVLLLLRVGCFGLSLRLYFVGRFFVARILCSCLMRSWWKFRVFGECVLLFRLVNWGVNMVRSLGC